MPNRDLAPHQASAAVGQLPARLVRTGRRLRRSLPATSAANAAAIDLLGRLLIFTGLLIHIAVGISPTTARRGQTL